MARLFDGDNRIVPTWLAVSRFLLTQPNHSARNLLLEISDPTGMPHAEREVLRKVDGIMAARMRNLTIETVANTIFPQGIYVRHGRSELYPRYHRVIDRAKKEKTWGTYFDRMTRRVSSDGAIVNPLEKLVEKLKRAAQPDARTYQSAFELSPCNPAEDLGHYEMGEELSTYEPSRDANLLRGGPCLSHLSFKISGKTILDLTAMYRSHHYCSRALGNLIGLSRLLQFVARESGLQVGTLSCLSTHAELDLASWGESGGGGTATARHVFDSL